MRAQIVTVGPLAASNASNIATSTKSVGSGQFIVLDGTLGNAVANSVCASQTPAGAGNLNINGTQAVTAGWNAFGGFGGTALANLGGPARIYITSAGNDSGNTFTVTGVGISDPGESAGGGFPLANWDSQQFGLTETITGANASKACSKNLYWWITSISISGAAGGAITVGHFSQATLDVPRQIGIASAGNDTAVNFTLVGTDWANMAITEVLAGANASTANSVLSYKTLLSVSQSASIATTLTIGTTGVAYSPWANFDALASMAPTGIQVNGTGTVNWTVQQTYDDPNSPTNPVTPNNMKWVAAGDPNLVGSAVIAGVQSNYLVAPTWARILLNSGSGTVTATFSQPFII